MKHLSIIIRWVKVIPEVKLRKLPTGPIGFEVKAPSLLILGCISRSPSNEKKWMKLFLQVMHLNASSILAAILGASGSKMARCEPLAEEDAALISLMHTSILAFFSSWSFRDFFNSADSSMFSDCLSSRDSSLVSQFLIWDDRLYLFSSRESTFFCRSISSRSLSPSLVVGCYMHTVRLNAVESYRSHIGLSETWADRSIWS